MNINPLDTPEKLAHYLTDNGLLQRHLVAFLTTKNIELRTKLDTDFWAFVETFSEKEKTELKQAKKQIAVRMLDRTSSVALFLKEQKMESSVLA
jgi:hypothetical protein